MAENKIKTEKLIQICKDALLVAHKTISSLEDEGTSEVHDDHVVDICTKGDMAVSDALIKFFEKQKIPAVLYSEERGRIQLIENPTYTIVFDDIDGTDNYFRGRGILPYCTLVCVFDSVNPCFKDALAAAVIEHNSGKIWHASRGNGCYLNNIKVNTSKREILDRRTLVAINHSMRESDVSKISGMYGAAWVKDFGLAALHLAGISSGMFDAFISPVQKAHELGAGYLLIKEASGFLIDLDGNILDNKKYDFDADYWIIAASTQKLCMKLLSKINQ